MRFKFDPSSLSLKLRLKWPYLWMCEMPTHLLPHWRFRGPPTKHQPTGYDANYWVQKLWLLITIFDFAWSGLGVLEKDVWQRQVSWSQYGIACPFVEIELNISLQIHAIIWWHLKPLTWSHPRHPHTMLPLHKLCHIPWCQCVNWPF